MRLNRCKFRDGMLCSRDAGHVGRHVNSTTTDGRSYVYYGDNPVMKPRWRYLSSWDRVLWPDEWPDE